MNKETKEQILFNVVTPADKEMIITTTTDSNKDTYKYEISFVDSHGQEQIVTIPFQHGPIKEHGINGISAEVLISILIYRLTIFQQSSFACDENALALEYLKAALEALNSRTRNRIARNVEGLNKQ